MFDYMCLVCSMDTIVIDERKIDYTNSTIKRNPSLQPTLFSSIIIKKMI